MPRDPNAQEIVAALGLSPHPEGGAYREVWRAAESIPAGALPPRYEGTRRFGTSIYYLLRTGDVSAFHRVRSDEIWYHLLGAPLEMAFLPEEGEAGIARLGVDLLAGERPQIVVPRGTWQAARVAGGGDFTLVGCTVAPGFEFADFEMGTRADLLRAHPRSSELIRSFTRAGPRGR